MCLSPFDKDMGDHMRHQSTLLHLSLTWERQELCNTILSILQVIHRGNGVDHTLVCTLPKHWHRTEAQA